MPFIESLLCIRHYAYYFWFITESILLKKPKGVLLLFLFSRRGDCFRETSQLPRGRVEIQPQVL